MKQKIVDEDCLNDIVDKIQNNIIKEYNPTILEYELILKLLNERLMKKKVEARSSGMLTDMLPKIKQSFGF